jgi:hypothetical protein
MGFKEHDRERWSERFERWRRPQHGLAPRERPLGDENFDQDREDWREPMELSAQRPLQWGGESLRRGYYPRRQSHPRESGLRARHGVRLGAGLHAGKGPKGYRRSDERISRT